MRVKVFHSLPIYNRDVFFHLLRFRWNMTMSAAKLNSGDHAHENRINPPQGTGTTWGSRSQKYSMDDCHHKSTFVSREKSFGSLPGNPSRTAHGSVLPTLGSVAFRTFLYMYDSNVTFRHGKFLMFDSIFNIIIISI